MRTILAVLFMSASLAHASTNYVYYNSETREPQLWTNSCAYNMDRDTVRMGNVTLGGIDWSVIRVATTTNPIPKPFTDIDQVDHKIILPITEDAKRDPDNWLNPQLKAILEALIEAHNGKAPADEQLDWGDVKAAIKAGAPGGR